MLINDPLQSAIGFIKRAVTGFDVLCDCLKALPRIVKIISKSSRDLLAVVELRNDDEWENDPGDNESGRENNDDQRNSIDSILRN